MALFNCFKSAKELENEKRREAHHNERLVEQALDNYDFQIAKLIKQRDAVWSQARELLKSGRRADAQRTLIYFKRYDLSISKLENQKAYLTDKVIQISSTGNAAAALAYIRKMAASQNINPETLAENIEEMDIITQDIADTDKQMTNAFNRDLSHMAKEEASAGIQYEDAELMAALEKECVAEINGQAVPAEKNSALDEGVERLKKLLGGK